MKKLSFPNFDRAIVKELCCKVSDVVTAQKHWKRNYGKYKAFKAHVTTNMKDIQSKRCAYCGTRLHEKKPHRDHIAPKNPHYKWTFWPINLVLTCYCCNTDLKGETETVDVLARSYRRTTFKIVHPFLDDPADHLNFYLDKNSILIQAKNSSAKGDATITLFDLMAPERAKERAKDFLFDEDVDHLVGMHSDMFENAVNAINENRLLLRN